MKKVVIALLVLILGSFTSYSQLLGESAKQVYSAPHLRDSIANHKLVAILPFNVSISYRRPPKNFDPAANKEEERSLAKNLQSEMFTYLLNKNRKYTVEFQDVDVTNSLIKKAGLWDKLDDIPADSLAKLLKVSSVIKCTYEYEKTATEAGAILKTALFGSIGSKTASGLLTMQIKNGTNGSLLWRFSKSMDEVVFSSASQLIERMMRKVSRNFPYAK